jgi:benzoate-CoA ligase family protein
MIPEAPNPASRDGERAPFGNPSVVLDRQVEAGRGDKVALRAPDGAFTYAELLGRVNRAGHLLRELGVRREDRVVLVLDDTSAFPALFLGAIRIGAVPVPVSPLDKADNYRHFVHDSYTDLVVADPALADLLREVAGDVPVLTTGEDLERRLAEHSDELAAEPMHADDMAFWLYSSGSTGLPKGVVHLQHDIEMTCRSYAGQVIGLREDDVLFSTTKLYHAYGLGNGLNFPLHFGATSVLMSGPPKPDRILARLREERPTVFFSVPALFGLLAREPDAEDAFESVRFCVSAAEALAPAIYDRFLDRFGLEIIDGIGSTEMLHIFCSNRPGAVERGTTGRPVPGYELRIVDEDGHPLDGPAVGNLEVRGDSCAAFYWHQHEKTKRCMRGDWFFTGDRYRRTEDGAYAYEGRVDDMLKVGGLWVSPVDMENCLTAHPSVAGVGVVGVTIDDATRIAAYVERTPDGPEDEQLAEDLRAWCKAHLRRYEYPHFVHFVPDLPRTVTGKVQRFRLRELADRSAPIA